MNEHSRKNHINSNRRSKHQSLGAREKFSITLGSASENYSTVGSRSFQSRHSQAIKYFPSNCSVVARTFFSPSVTRITERRSSSRTFSKDSPQKSYCDSQCNPAYNASPCDSLEYPQYGRSTRSQQCNCPTHMERTQSKTSSGQNIQTQPRQEVSRKTLRYCGSLSESSRQSYCLLCRRKKPDSSAGTNSTLASLTPRYSCKTDSRLPASWYHHLICSLKYTRWHCHRRLHAKTQTSGIHQIPAAYQYKNPVRFRSSFDCRQLRNAQAPTSSELAKASSTFLLAFYSDIQFLVELGGTMVFRDHFKKNTSWLIQKCKRAHYSNQTIY